MTLISLEDVQDIISKIKINPNIPTDKINQLSLLERINSLPTINPVKVLEEMIDEHKTLRKNAESERDMIKFDAKLSILIEARNRINQ